MSLRSFESMILWELRRVTNRQSLRLKDIAEWSTSEDTVKKNMRVDEEYFFLPGLKVHCAIKSKEAVKAEKEQHVSKEGSSKEL